MNDCADPGEIEMPIRNRLSRNLSPLGKFNTLWESLVKNVAVFGWGAGREV